MIDENEIEPTEKYWVQVIGVTPIVITPVVVMTNDVLEFVAPESTKKTTSPDPLNLLNREGSVLTIW